MVRLNLIGQISSRSNEEKKLFCAHYDVALACHVFLAAPKIRIKYCTLRHLCVIMQLIAIAQVYE